MIVDTGVYRCDFEKSSMPEWKLQYNWLVAQMKKRIGEPPAGVSYPVWAWYRQFGRREKPDLRRERWCYGSNGMTYRCMEIEIPDDQVLLSDFDMWNLVLMDALISRTEAEDDMLCAEYDKLSDDGKKKMLENNWERVFDITPFENDWTLQGDSVQATFWELRREQIRRTWTFKSASVFPKYPR